MNVGRALVQSMMHFSLPSLVMATAFVACSPGSGEVPIKARPPIAPDSCVAKLRRYEGRVDQAKSGKSPKNEICEAKPGAPGKPVAYQKAQVSARYTVSSVKTESLTVKLKIGVEFEETVDEKVQIAAVAIMKSQCVGRLERLWSKTNQKVDLDIALERYSEAEDYDQILRLLSNEAPNKKIGFVMERWPDRGRMQKADALPQDCADSDCRAELQWRANARFCTEFALVAAQWLGLKSAEATAEGCAKPAPPSEAKGPVTGGFLKASGLSDSPDEFWSRAQFSESDLKSILKPACTEAVEKR